MKKTNKAFTLIELLVVVLIIGILAAIALPQYHKAVAKSRASEALSVIKSLIPAIDEYVLVYGKAPKTFTELSILPQGELSKFSIQDDLILGKYYNFVLTSCRLDVGPVNPDSSEPAFLYQACADNWSFQPGNLYCYYITDSTRASDRDEICRQFTNSPIEEYSTKGRAYKM